MREISPLVDITNKEDDNYMRVEQYVMAYKVEQVRIRAMLPVGFESLRPVLRFNAEIRDDNTFYIELNTPVDAYGKKGWLNIAYWNSSEDHIRCEKNGSKTTFITDFLRLSFIGVGILGGCPAENSNDGCFYGINIDSLVIPEQINVRKEFCDGEFAFCYSSNDAYGESYGGKTLPATPEESKTVYPKVELTAENAAKIKCEQMLGQYKVVFDR